MAEAAGMGDRLTKHAKEIGSETVAAARDLKDDVIDKAGEYVGAAKDFAVDQYEAVVDGANAAKKSTEKMIKKNPWAAVGIAVGVGVVLGMLLKSRSRD